MPFKDSIGHQQEIDELLAMHANDRLPHALLFHGPAGNGKLQIAHALAQYLLCDQPTATDACGVCPSCVKSAKLIHPDLHFSYPTHTGAKIASQVLPEWRKAFLDNPYLPLTDWLVAMNASDSQQGKIYKDECVEIVKKLSLRAFGGKRKILILWLPELLMNEGNRLLKLIEEPTDDTLFILVSENLELVLTTIISRCQLVRFGPLSDQNIISALTENQLATTDDAKNIALLADGNFHLAKHIAEVSVEEARDAQFLDWLRLCYRSDKRVEWIKSAEQFAKGNRDQQKFFFQYGLLFLRELLVVKYGSAEKSRLNENERKSAAGIAKLLDLEAIRTLEEAFSAAIYHIQRNANPKLVHIGLAIRINRIFHGSKVPA